MYAVSFYDSDPDNTDPRLFERLVETYPRHRAYLDEFAKNGQVVMIGTFADPKQGSMAVFRSREAAEAFRENDPFYTEGLVWRSRILDWNPLVFGEAGDLQEG